MSNLLCSQHHNRANGIIDDPMGYNGDGSLKDELSLTVNKTLSLGFRTVDIEGQVWSRHMGKKRQYFGGRCHQEADFVGDTSKTKKRRPVMVQMTK